MFLTSFYGRDIEKTGMAHYSHWIRWWNTSRTWRFFSDRVNQSTPMLEELIQGIAYPHGFSSWSSLSKAQYLEITTFLSAYLLSSQGDRVALSHSVEGRYPFLDYRVVEFCARLPDDLKLRGLQEKWLLRQLGKQRIPEEIWRRRKKPYRAPIQRSFFGKGPELDYLRDLLSPSALLQSGYFQPHAVAKLIEKAQKEQRLSEVEEMALVGVISTQLVDHLFVQKKGFDQPARQSWQMKVIDQVTEARRK